MDGHVARLLAVVRDGASSANARVAAWRELFERDAVIASRPPGPLSLPVPLA